jgi:hypothetical protein
VLRTLDSQNSTRFARGSRETLALTGEEAWQNWYVDNSNGFIEGKRVKAVESGLAMNIYDAMNNRILDNSYKIDFGRLHHFIAGDDKAKIKRCILLGSRPPPNDSLWNIACKVARLEPLVCVKG